MKSQPLALLSDANPLGGRHVLAMLLAFFGVVFAVNGYFLFAALSTQSALASQLSLFVGLGPLGRQIPVVCVEMEPGRSFGPEIEQALRTLAAGTAVDGRIARFLPHPTFPTDARHNSKIRREDLVGWAESQCADLLRAAS